MTVVEREPRPTAAERPTAGPLLECTGVCKRFGAVEALVDVDLEVYAGEVVALVSDNGAGKSTLIKSISGRQPPERGSFRFEGRDAAMASGCCISAARSATPSATSSRRATKPKRSTYCTPCTATRSSGR